MSTSSSGQSRSPGPHPSGGGGTDDQTRHKAGAFDIRNFIGGLIGIYGLVLVIYGLIGSSDAQLAKSGGININLLAGLGMVLVAAGFFLWARLRPVVVPARGEEGAVGVAREGAEEGNGAADTSDMGRPPGGH